MTFKDGIYSVTIGGVMEDWQKWELIKKFREEFTAADIVIYKEDGVNISGESSTRRSF